MNFKKAITLVLTVCLLLSATCVSVGAAEVLGTASPMEDQTTDMPLYYTNGKVKAVSLVDDPDSATVAEHGKVLQFQASGVGRLTFSGLKVERGNTGTAMAGKKYIISFDAKANATDTAVISMLGTEGGITGASYGAGHTNYITGYNGGASFTLFEDDTWNSAFAMYIDGVKVEKSARFTTKYSTSWQRFVFVIDTTDIADSSEDAYNYLAARYSNIYFAIGGNGYNYVYLDNLTVSVVDPVNEAVAPETVADNAAYSIRGATAAEGENLYVSAGLRFKATVDSATKANADEIGFAIIPAKNATADWYKFDAEGKLTGGALTASAYVKGTKDVIYAIDDATGAYTYQMILTGLSTKDGKTAYSLRCSAVMYIKTGDSYEYLALGEASYTEVKAMYQAFGLEDMSKY